MNTDMTPIKKLSPVSLAKVSAIYYAVGGLLTLVIDLAAGMEVLKVPLGFLTLFLGLKNRLHLSSSPLDAWRDFAIVLLHDSLCADGVGNWIFGCPDLQFRLGPFQCSDKGDNRPHLRLESVTTSPVSANVYQDLSHRPS